MSELFVAFKSKHLEISDSEYIRHTQIYSNVDLCVEYNLMDEWLRLHPHRRGTRIFVSRWLAKEQRKAVASKREAMVGANPYRDVKVKAEALERGRERR